MRKSERPGPVDLRLRTRQFAVRIAKVYLSLTKGDAVAQTFGKQLLRSGSSVGAHCAEASRAKSRADFTSKIDGAMQELAETEYWLDLLIDLGFVKAAKLAPLKAELSELTAIFVSMVKQTRERK